jgi:hypothetical protein
MRSLGLYVKNQTEEFIGNVFLEESASGLLSRIVVVDYTRDEQILCSPTSGLTLSSESHHEKFIGFAKYLRERRKVPYFGLFSIVVQDSFTGRCRHFAKQRSDLFPSSFI